MICFVDNTKQKMLNIMSYEGQAVSQAQLFEEEPNPKEAFREIRNYLRYSCLTLGVEWSAALLVGIWTMGVGIVAVHDVVLPNG